MSIPQRISEWQETVEEIPWELFRGRLLDPAQTRQRVRFQSWNLYWLEEGIRSAEPLLSLKLDERREEVHVVRAILSYAWEGYHAGDNVYLSRETAPLGPGMGRQHRARPAAPRSRTCVKS